MIPKIIHYVWVGDKPKSDLVLKCIDSWKKFCPDYEIIEWGNDKIKDFDNLYLQQAFDNKKWAFVSDYIRLYALKYYGGLYFDTDLEITNSLDKFLNLQFFSGFEDYHGVYSPITSAIMGAVKDQKIICDLLDEYKNIPFIRNGICNQTTNTARITKYFEKNFNVSSPYNPNETIKLTDECIIYPSYYFCVPQNNKQNYSIHHFNGSWLDAYKRTIIFSIGNYRIAKFSKRKNEPDAALPLLKNEIILFQFRFLKYKICLIKY